MRDLTSLHATMAAATKSGQPRTKRSQPSTGSAGSNSASGSGSPGAAGPAPRLVKEEDDPQSLLPNHQRPGTTTGYEGQDHHTGILYQAPAWHVQTSADMDRPTSRLNNHSNHSFRDHHHPGQSFLAPSASSSSNISSAQSQSFLPFSTYSFSFPDHQRDERPGSSSSRPPTSGAGSESHPRSLPPLASVVPGSIPPPPSHQPQHPSFPPPHHVLPFQSFRRPSTATRPGTAPATYFAGPGVVNRPDLSFLPYGRDMAAPPPSAAAAHHPGSYDPDSPHSPHAGPQYDSPFSFHPPALSDLQPQPAAFSYHSPGSSSAAAYNPRKRPFTGTDGPEPTAADFYDYGSESRPQSRRLTVMELCNDTTPSSVLLPGLGGSPSRPGTSSGLISSASALALIDRSPTLAYTGGTGPVPVLARTLSSAGDPNAAAGVGTGTAGGGGGETYFGGNGLSPVRRAVSNSYAAAAAAASPSAHASSPTSSATSILSPIRGSPSLSDASVGGYGSSPRASPLNARTPTPASASAPSPRGATYVSGSAARTVVHAPSAAAAASPPDAVSRRLGPESEHDQVRITVPAAHTSPAPVGMRV